MARTNGEGRLKKHSCCLTCSIVCLVLLIVFIVALYVGGTVMFRTYVSPHIGGLSLNDAIALAANVLSGKEAKATYTEEDLDDFYSGLSDAMFLSDKSENELEYELIPDETRATLAPGSSSSAAEEGEGEGEGTENSSYDEDLAYDAFCLKTPAERYALLPEETRSLLTLAEFSALAGETDAAVAARKKVGLKTYRLSLRSVLEGVEFDALTADPEKVLDKTASSLEFNFESLENYDIDNAAAEQNEKFTTFSVTGNQTSAFINDTLAYLLTMADSPITSGMADFIPKEIDLTSFVKVASVTIMNTPLATSGDEALYDQKDTALGVTISIALRAIVEAALQTVELSNKLSGVPSFALNLIPKLVPKHFSAGLTIYPLANEEDGREIKVTINKPSDKNAARLSTLVNALLGKEEEGDASKTFFGTINDKIASTFKSINEKVKINFVPTKDKDGNVLKDGNGNTYSSMHIMTLQTLLSLIDKDGRLSAHDAFTMLKCLYVSKNAHIEIDTDTAMGAFKTDMSNKYGVDASYLDDHNVFSTEDLSGMVNHIDLSSITFQNDVEAMRVHLSAEALAAFMKKYVTEQTGDTSTAAAEDDSATSLLKGMDLKITDVTVQKISEAGGVSIFSFELGILVDLQKMVEDQLPKDGIGGTLSKKILPKGESYFCIKLYLSEYTDTETDKLMHKVGKNIDNPAEGETSAYLSDIRINDFTYDQTSRVFDALNTFMEVLSGSSFKVSSITGYIEDSVNSVFNSISGNDFSVDLRLYSKTPESTDRGGLTLPSLYELLRSVVKPKLQPGETFSEVDAKDVLIQIYQSDADTTAYFEEAQAEEFIDEINDKYYIKTASALTVSDLFGKDEGGNSNASNLSNKIKAESIYFKPDATEAALWDGAKASLYGDSRSVSALRIRLSGTEVAALVEESNLVPTDIAAAFGTIEVLGAKFKTEDGKTYLTFDLKLVKKEDDSELKFGKAFPAAVKLSAKILLYAPSYTEEAPRYSARIIINDAASEKAFLLLRALGGDDLSESAIANKISESLSTTFNTLEGKIPLFYSDGGTPYMSGTEECILISDVFSFLIKETSMTDLDSEATDPSDLAARLRGFGGQASGDSANEGIYSWITGLNLFAYSDDGDDSNDDDAYIYKNMKDAYFMKAELNLDDIYGNGTFTNKFNEIKTTDFNLKDDANGLFYYGGDIKNLKISDKALGVIVKKKQNFSGSVAGAGMTAEIMSLKLTIDGADLVIKNGIKIAFDNRNDYLSMPHYFFVIATTRKSGSTYTTSLSMNNLATIDTDELFQNITALESKGLKADSFNKADIENTINSAIESAFNNLPSSVTFGAFTQTDLTNEYHTGAVYPVGCALPAVGAGYLCFPSVYSYMIDLFYTSNKPQEEDMQHMILSLHSTTVADEIVTNEKSSTAYHVTQAYKGNNMINGNDYVVIYSDKYLAHEISLRLSGENINGDISLANGIDQSIILRAGLGSAEWGDWEEKFFEDPSVLTYNSAQNYLIVTACVSLAGYASGNADLLPSDLYLSVLVDLDDYSSSKGLLYNMNHEDMAIFEYIMRKYNSQFVSITDMAVQLANIINNKLAAIKSVTIPGYGTINFDLNYRLSSDSFLYTNSLPYSAGAASDVSNEWNDDGVGYVILSNGPIV